MANLPSNRTKLNVAIANQQPSIVASSQANREALVEAYDTIDLLNQKADSLVAGGLLVPFPPAGVSRQAFINGNFDFWQRGTSFSATGYAADRWRLGLGSGAAVTVSQQLFTPGQTIVPNNPNYYVQIATSIVGSAYSSFAQRIEDVGTFANQKISVGFWAKCLSGTTSLQFSGFQSFGSGGSSVVGLSAVNVTLSTNWQYFSGTLNIPSVTGKTIGANSHLNLEFRIQTTEAANTISIAQVQLNAGSVALPYQPMHPAIELAMCQRYYEKSFASNVVPATNTGLTNTYQFPQVVGASASQSTGTLFYKTTKRITPTVTLFNPVADNALMRNSTSNVDCTTTTIEKSSDQSFSMLVVTGAGTSAGGRLNIHWTADAEL